MKIKALLAAAITAGSLGVANAASGEAVGLTVLDAEYVVPEKLKGTHTKEGVRAAMDHLIDRATHFDVEALETIYHKDFHTTMVMPDKTVTTFSKNEFIEHFRKQAEGKNKTQLNTYADWHDFHVLGDTAVSVLTRNHSGMTGEEMELLCNIEFRFEDGRWQVLREQIFLRPLSETKNLQKRK